MWLPPGKEAMLAAQSSPVSGIAFAAIVLATGGPMITPSVSLFQVLGYNLLIVASILTLRVLFTIFRNR
jgi:ubiquinone biosynthesis protein